MARKVWCRECHVDVGSAPLGGEGNCGVLDCRCGGTLFTGNGKVEDNWRYFHSGGYNFLDTTCWTVARFTGRVSWGFQVSVLPRYGCQEGFGASSSLIGLDLENTVNLGGGYFPVTWPTLCKERGAKSFGVSLTGSIENRVLGNRVDTPGSTPPKSMNAKQDDLFSFFLHFAPDQQHATVHVFLNSEPLFTLQDVDTSLPLYPTVNICCAQTSHNFVRNPPVPPSLRGQW
ncbi:hypothetical protein Pelo_7916 [Pelomyxa schiedti]|nr:hypothetical protein Pelo_7916 [Pelomyxa schiedti]